MKQLKFDIYHDEENRSLRIVVYTFPEWEYFESSASSFFDSDDEIDEDMGDEFDSLFRGGIHSSKKEERLSLHAATTEYLCHPSVKGTTSMFIDLSRLQNAHSITANDWKQVCHSIQINQRELQVLKVIGPSDWFMFGVNRKDTGDSIGVEFGSCLLAATPNLTCLQFQRVAVCPQVFCELQNLKNLKSLVLSGVHDRMAESHTTWFSLAASLGTLKRISRLSLHHVVFYADRHADMGPPWDLLRFCICQMKSLQSIRFNECYSVQKPHGKSCSGGGTKLYLIQFSQAEEEELQYYPRLHLERLYYIVRLYGPEMQARSRN